MATNPAKHSANASDLARLGRVSAYVSTAILLVIFAMLALFVFAISHSLYARGHFPPGWAVNWIPAIFYIWALWTLRKLFIAVVPMDMEIPILLASATSRIGLMLVVGAISTSIPFINFFSTPAPRGGVIVVFLVPALTLLTVGLAMMLLAHVTKRAVALEAEAKQLKGELGEFF
jgi:hypothetical protein